MHKRMFACSSLFFSCCKFASNVGCLNLDFPRITGFSRSEESFRVSAKVD